MALTDYIIMPSVDYQAACNKIREKTGKTDLIKSGDLVTEIEAIAGGGGGGSVDGAYVTYTLNDAGEITAAALHGFTEIPQSMFMGCVSLETVDLSDSPNITGVGAAAFFGCAKLTMDAIPESVTKIGASSFGGCNALALTKLPDALTEIPSNAFNECTALTLTELPAGITSIGDSAFRKCPQLAVSELPEGLITIGEDAFYGCTSITISRLGSNIQSVGSQAFYNCTGLVNIEIGAVALVQDTVYGGSRTFDGCTNLEKVWIRSTCDTIYAPSEYDSPFGGYMGCPETLAIYAEDASKQDGWGLYFTGNSTVPVTYGQTECPW